MKISNINSSSLVRNISCLGASEIAIRITRLLTAAILARQLSPHEFGIIAIAMTVQEITQTLTRNGIGAKIVQTQDHALASTCNRVYRLNWQINSLLFFIQCALARPIADFYQDESLFFLIISLAVPYLIYPFAMVQVYLVQRENKLQITALANGSQVSIDNISSAIMALSGLGVWSVILPKLIVAPLWVVFYRSIQSWRASKSTRKDHLQQDILAFSCRVLGSELCTTGRRHIDKLLIGHFLGLDILGIYYFAVNAGLGLSLSLVAAFNTAFYPHLCKVNQSLPGLRKEFRKGLKLISLLSLIIFTSQALLAPWYVPLIFGSEWLHALPIILILILSAILRPVADACSQMLRAINNPRVDFRWNIFFTLTLSSCVFWATHYNIETVAFIILLSHTLLLPVYIIGSWYFLARKPGLKTAVDQSNTKQHTIASDLNTTYTKPSYLLIKQIDKEALSSTTLLIRRSK